MERVVSVLNLGLQGVALAREEMSDEMEKIFKKYNGMGEVGSVAKAHEREVVGPPLVVDENARTELGHRLLMQQKEYDCDASAREST